MNMISILGRLPIVNLEKLIIKATNMRLIIMKIRPDCSLNLSSKLDILSVK